MNILAFIFGACIGSFLNVCIYRIPAALSIVHPGSSCPHCKTMIPFYDNIPILSYLLLMGKCRNCEATIAIRYPFVELLGGLFALACALVFGPTLHGLVVFTFIATLIVVTFIDLDHRIIPDTISLPGIPLFFLAALAVPRWKVVQLPGLQVRASSRRARHIAFRRDPVMDRPRCRPHGTRIFRSVRGSARISPVRVQLSLASTARRR